MPLFQIYFAPEGRIVGREYGENASQARKRFVRTNPKYKRACEEPREGSFSFASRTLLREHLIKIAIATRTEEG